MEINDLWLTCLIFKVFWPATSQTWTTMFVITHGYISSVHSPHIPTFRALTCMADDGNWHSFKVSPKKSHISWCAVSSLLSGQFLLICGQQYGCGRSLLGQKCHAGSLKQCLLFVVSLHHLWTTEYVMVTQKWWTEAQNCYVSPLWHWWACMHLHVHMGDCCFCVLCGSVQSVSAGE